MNCERPSSGLQERQVEQTVKIDHLVVAFEIAVFASQDGTYACTCTLTRYGRQLEASPAVRRFAVR